VDQNLEIDIDLGSLDQEAFNTFQLRLSYSFLNGRLRVTRNGSFNNQYSSEAANLIGDWTIDYILTPDGKFKIKMFSRSNYNQLNSSVGTQTAITTGVSLLHTQNFNQLKDLIQSSREKRRKQILEDPANEDAILENDETNHKTLRINFVLPVNILVTLMTISVFFQVCVRHKPLIQFLTLIQHD
jgi:hypothetical protein